MPQLLRPRELHGVDLDSAESLKAFREIMKRKPFLRKVYTRYYNIMKRESAGVPAGKRIEIGSGPGFIKEVIPGTITTDVVKQAGIDRVVSGEKLPFRSGTLGCIYVLNVVHHIGNPERFFRECERCLKLHGRLVMIEPSNTLFGRFIFANFCSEGFDAKAGWRLKGRRRLTGSNQALPWIIFFRDREKFEELFPNLKIRKLEVHTPLIHVVSGGLRVRQFVPGWTYPLFAFLDVALAPFNRWLGMFYTIVLEKA